MSSSPAPQRRRLIPMALDGWRFTLPLLAIACIALVFSLYWTAAIIALLAACVGAFFRDPERDIPLGSDLILSPADGVARYIEQVTVQNADGEEVRMKRISIVLSIFNAHIQRTPTPGRVVSVQYNPGKFLNAFNDKSSEENENNMIWIKSDRGAPIGVRQIAGLVARRVICWRAEGDTLARGERIGLIRFGSRCEVFLPLEAEALINAGENVKAGLSILARFPAQKREE